MTAHPRLAHRIVAAAFAAFVALPLVWLAYLGFLPPRAVMEARLLPTGVSLANFAELRGSGLGRALALSLTVSGISVAGQLALGLAAAYAIRLGLRVRWLVLVTLVLPVELLLIPMYGLLQQLSLLDTALALILPFLARPVVIFLLVQALQRFPMELLEAAALDGARLLVTQYLGQQPHIMKASGVPQELLDEIGKVLTWPATHDEVVAASKLVPDDIVQMITASGTPDEVRAKVDEYVAAGCTCPILYPLAPDVRLMIDTFAR